MKSINEQPFAAFNNARSVNTEEEIILGDWGYGRGTWKNTLTPKAGGGMLPDKSPFRGLPG